MARHFLQLYLLIVVTLAAVSWGQERLWQIVRPQTRPNWLPRIPRRLRMLRRASKNSCAHCPTRTRQRFVADLARDSGVDLELFELKDIAGATRCAARARRAARS